MNPDKIEFIEETPDTVMSLDSGRKVVIRESARELQDMIVAYRRAVYLGVPLAYEKEERR